MKVVRAELPEVKGKGSRNKNPDTSMLTDGEELTYSYSKASNSGSESESKIPGAPSVPKLKPGDDVTKTKPDGTKTLT